MAVYTVWTTHTCSFSLLRLWASYLYPSSDMGIPTPTLILTLAPLNPNCNLKWQILLFDEARMICRSCLLIISFISCYEWCVLQKAQCQANETAMCFGYCWLLGNDLFIAELSRMPLSNEEVGTEILKRRPKTRSSALIWSLPAELLLHLFKGLQIKDLLNLRSVNAVCHYEQAGCVF